MKVDKKTFTISSIDQDEFTSSLNDKGLVNEFTIQDRAGESE